MNAAIAKTLPALTIKVSGVKPFEICKIVVIRVLFCVRNYRHQKSEHCLFRKKAKPYPLLLPK